MALETHDRELGSRGYTYHVTELPSKKGRALLVRLIKVLGPVFGQLVSGMKPSAPAKRSPLPPRDDKPREGAPKALDVTGSALSAIDGESISRAMAELSSRFTEADLEHVCSVLGEYSEISHPDTSEAKRKLTPALQEFHFAGKYLELFEWIGFALSVNFSDFFSGSQIGNAIAESLAGATEQANPAATSPSESPAE